MDTLAPLLPEMGCACRSRRGQRQSAAKAWRRPESLACSDGPCRSRRPPA